MTHDMNDDVERRLRDADPARAPHVYRPDAAFIDELTEATMTTTHTDTARQSRRIPLAVAAGTVTILGLGAVAFGALGSSEDDAPGETIRLTLPSSAAASSCIGYSIDVLAGMPTAFSGEAVAVTNETVTVSVDTWYRGGDAETVVLAAPPSERVALDGLAEFVEGGRYLVTASEDGAVNGCGYSGPWSSEGAADFDTAFND